MFSQGSLSSLTLNSPSSFPEIYAPLWWYSGSYVASLTNYTSAGSAWLKKGTTSAENVLASDGKLITFSANWSASTKVSLEIALNSGSSGNTGYAALWDVTANAIVSATQVSTTSTTFTVLRSGQSTLTPGHQYAVTVWSGSGSYYPQFTDASLIIFPPAGSVSPSLSSISLANPSGGTLKEGYYPLWVYSSGNTSNTGSGATTYAWIGKGATSASPFVTGSATSSNKLHVLNSSWSPTQKFAFEVSLWAQSGATAYATLWDITANTQVTSSELSTTSTTATLLRSGSFTLTPGHTYGVALKSNTTSAGVLMSKAHLVALGG